MEEGLDLVLATASPLRDRSNEVDSLEPFKTPSKRRSRGGEDRLRRLSRDSEELRRLSRGSEELENRSIPESEMMSFDEMRKQLSMWQTHLGELAEEQKEAERLRQDTTCLRSKLSNCEAEASDRSRRLAETRVQVQEKVQELADTHEQLNKKFIELAKEKEVSEHLRREMQQMTVSMKEMERRCVALEADVASLTAEMTAERVHFSRLQARNCELEDELAQAQQLSARNLELEEEIAQVSQASTEASRRLQAQECKIAELVSNSEMQQAEVVQARAECRSWAREAAAGQQQQQAQMEALTQELEAHRDLATSLESELEQERKQRLQHCQVAETEKLAMETEVVTLRGALDSEQKLSQAQQQELAALRSEASGRQLQLEDLQLAVGAARQAYSGLEAQRCADVEALQTQLREASELAAQEKQAAAEGLQEKTGEVQRLLSVEASLRAALEGRCQQIAVQAQAQKEAQQQLEELRRAHSLSLAQQREELAQRQADVESQEAHAAAVAALKLEVSQATSALEASQQEAVLWKQRAEILLGRRKAAMTVASRWHGGDAAWDWLMEQGQGAQELQDLPEGAELRLQNRELCLSLRQFKQDCELLEAENLSLKEALSGMEDDLHRVSDQHAQLVGHVNHRQKIRYTMKLKEEINRLYGDLKKARQRIVQLEVNKESEGLFEALASVVGGESYTGPGKSRRGSSRLVPQSARRSSFAPKAPARRGDAGNGRDDVDQQMRLADAEQLCLLQQSALDRISLDFQHLKALIERAVQLADAERRHGAEGGNFAALLHRLREIIAASHRNAPSGGGAPDELGKLPVAATSMTCDDDDDELAEGDSVCYGHANGSEVAELG